MCGFYLFMTLLLFLDWQWWWGGGDLNHAFLIVLVDWQQPFFVDFRTSSLDVVGPFLPCLGIPTPKRKKMKKKKKSPATPVAPAAEKFVSPQTTPKQDKSADAASSPAQKEATRPSFVLSSKFQVCYPFFWTSLFHLFCWLCGVV